MVRRAASGFTLIELMLVVAIAAILAAVGLPAYNDFVRNQRIKNASFDLFSTLVLARSEAVTRNASVTVTPSGSNWASGWTVVSGTTTIRTQNSTPNVTITGPTSVTYNGTGRLSAALSDGFELTASGGGSIQSRCITVDLSGRPVTKAATC